MGEAPEANHGYLVHPEKDSVNPGPGYGISISRQNVMKGRTRTSVDALP
jgi:hypothetical protein